MKEFWDVGNISQSDFYFQKEILSFTDDERDENLSTINVRIYLTYQQLTASNKQGRWT